MTKSLGMIAATGLVLALMFFVLAALMSPDSFRAMRGGGSADSHPDVRQWAWEGSDRFEIRVPAKVRLTAGGTPAVIVHGNSDVLKQLDFHDGVLEGGDRSDCVIMIFCPGGSRRDRVDVEVRGVALNELDVSGVADVDLGHMEQDRLKLRVSGAGNIEGEGHVGSLDLSISGAGNANLGEMAVEHAKVKLSGAGNAEIAPSEDAAVNISGVGHVGLATKPKVLTSHVSGVGSVDGPGADHHHARNDDDDDRISGQVQAAVNKAVNDAHIEDTVQKSVNKALKDAPPQTPAPPAK